MPKHTHTRRHGVTNKLTPQCFSVITKQPLCCIRRLFIYSIPGLHSSPRPTALKAFQLRPRNSLHHSSILKGQAPLKTKLVCCIRQRGTYNDSSCKCHDSVSLHFSPRQWNASTREQRSVMTGDYSLCDQIISKYMLSTPGRSSDRCNYSLFC